MGYAFTGIADDATAVTTNPAGLVQMQSINISVITRFDGDWSNVEDSQAKFDASKKPVLDLNYAGIVVPITQGDNPITVGLAFSRLFNLNIDEKYSNPNSTIHLKSDGGISKLSLAGAIKTGQKLSFGASANIIFGSSKSYFNKSQTNSAYYSGFNLEGGAALNLSYAIPGFLYIQTQN